MRHLSLFSGIGGFDLASQWMGWENVAHCELNEFCRRVLKYYWPNAISYDDIKQTDFRKYAGQIDVLSGGFPCQPYSVAGQRRGKEDERHLWPEMLRAIRESKPTWVVGENVRGLLSWNGGMVFDEVQADLEAEGYEVLPFLLPACAVNAPHKRERIWFVAHAKCDYDSREERRSYGEEEIVESIVRKDNGSSWEFGRTNIHDAERHAEIRYDKNVTNSSNTGLESMQREWQDFLYGFDDAADANGLRGTQEYELQQSEVHKQHGEGRASADTDLLLRREGRLHETRPEETERYAGTRDARSFRRRDWENFPTQSPVCNGDDGISSRLDASAVYGSIKFPRQPARAFGRWRNESIKAGGNAIVPQVAYQIFQAIENNSWAEFLG